MAERIPDRVVWFKARTAIFSAPVLALISDRGEEALGLMRVAADLEGTTDKSPVTPAAIGLARELLGEMLLELREPPQALREFEASLQNEPNRFTGLYGAGKAAELSGDPLKAKAYYEKLVAVCEKADTEPAERVEAKTFLARREPTSRFGQAGLSGRSGTSPGQGAPLAVCPPAPLRVRGETAGTGSVMRRQSW